MTNLFRAINSLPTAVDRANAPLHAQERLLAVARDRLADLERQLAALTARYNSGEQGNRSLTASMALLNPMIEEQRRRVDELTESLRVARAVEESLENIGRRFRGDNRPQAPGISGEGMQAAQAALEQLMQRMTGARTILDEMNFAWSNHATRVAQANEAVRAAYGNTLKAQQQMARVSQQLRLQEQAQMLQVAETAAQTIQALWPKQKGAAIAAAVVNTAVGITRALSSLNPPWSWAQAALIAAAGAAQIATIRSTNLNSSGGGTPSVGGAAAQSEQEASPSRSLHVTGVDPAHLFSGSSVRGLIDMINEEVRNGVTLISTRNVPV